MRVLAGIALGGAGAALATLVQVVTVSRIRRVPVLQLRRLATSSLLLVLSAAVEELLFRVALIAVIGVVPAAMVFGIPHVVRGAERAERIANAASSMVFGLVLGWAWVEHRSFAEITAFHAAYNIVGGLILGSGAANPISNRADLPTATWPWALENRPGASAFGLAVTESVPIALAGWVLVAL